MQDESFDLDELERNVSQKTTTAWDSYVAPKTVTRNGRRTYSRRLSTGALPHSTASDVVSEESLSSISQEEKAFKDSAIDAGTAVPVPSLLVRRGTHPPIPARRRFFSRANSMSGVSNGGLVRSTMKRSLSVSNGTLSPPRREFRCLSDSCHADVENVRPGCEPLFDFISPKRGAGTDSNERGKKKVRSARHFGKKGLSRLSAPLLPTSSSFSHLARPGDRPSWGSTGASFARPDLPAFPPTPIGILSQEPDPSDSLESPTESSLGSSRKHGVNASLWDEFDDNTIGSYSTCRSKQPPGRSPLFTPTVNRLSSDFSINSADERSKFSRGDRGSASIKSTFVDSDDGLSIDDVSEGEDSGDDEYAEIKSRSPVPTFVPYGHKKKRPVVTISSSAVLRVEDVLNSIYSYEALKFIIITLRRESAGNNQSWYVVPPAKWMSNRRTKLLNWTTSSLGFSFRSGGNSVSFAQISKTKGKEMLKILEEILTHHKEKCKSAVTPGNDKQGLSNFSFVKTPAPMTSKAQEEDIIELPSLQNTFTPVMQSSYPHPQDDELMEGISAMNLEDRKDTPRDQKCTPATLKLGQGLCLDICADEAPFREPVRPSLENHASARDLMSHMGMTPEVRKGRPRLNRPPRLSLQSVGSMSGCGTASKMSAASPFPPLSISQFGLGSQMKNTPFEFVGTPMMKPSEQGWGSCPIDGRDWGTSQRTEQTVIDELTRKFEQCKVDAGLCDEDDLKDLQVSIGLDFDAACNYRDAPAGESPSSFGSPSEGACILEKQISQESPSESSPGMSNAIIENEGFPQIDEISQKRHNRRRQTSIAKHKRVSLIASATCPTIRIQNNRKSLFVRPPHRSALSIGPIPERIPAVPEFPLQVERTALETDSVASVVVDGSDTAFKDEDILHSILGYLNEHELMCTASLVNSKWADAAAHAHANLMMLSIGCTDQLEEELADDGNLDDHVQKYKGTCSASGIVERSWATLVNNYPWACFLSEGAYKKVYKVFNYAHRTEEAISVMDVDLIESTGNINVVAAELAVSVMLSSLVRRGVCPNFVATRGVFSCPFEPPKQHWGSATNKRPLGDQYSSPRPRKPKQPGRKKHGRYQYIRMELCDAGDAEEFLKSQADEAIDANEARFIFFQISFALHAAAVKCSLKHYDVKLLNIFLQQVQSEKSGDVVLRYGLGGHTFSLRSPRERAVFAKLADYGTANIDSGSNGKQVTIAQFTTLENTPPDFLILGDSACQGHGHDSFGLGLCMLHLFTGHAPYEEILSDVTCPPQLKKRIQKIWENEDETEFSVVRSVILSDVYKDEEGHILEGEPDDTLYDTLYKFLVLFGIPMVSSAFETSKVWIAVKETLDTASSENENGSRKVGKRTRKGDIARYRKDCRKYSLSHGNNQYIARARESLEKLVGGMELLQSLVCFDPQYRASALDVLNSSFMVSLREVGDQVCYSEDDEVLSYTALSTQN